MKTKQLFLWLITMIAAPVVGQEPPVETNERHRALALLMLIKEAPTDGGAAAQVSGTVLRAADMYMQGDELGDGSAEALALWTAGRAILHGEITAPAATIVAIIGAYEKRGIAEPHNRLVLEGLAGAARNGFEDAAAALYRIYKAGIEATNENTTIELLLARAPADQAAPHLAAIASTRTRPTDALHAIQALSKSDPGRAHLLRLERDGTLNEDAMLSIVHNRVARINQEICGNMPEFSACVMNGELRYGPMGHQDVNINLIACENDVDADACQQEYQRRIGRCLENGDVACADAVTLQFMRSGRQRPSG